MEKIRNLFPLVIGVSFFDQKQNEKDILSVGLAWSEQVIEKIPMEQHDCYLDFIITEDYCWDVNQQVKF
jgi:5-formyltetrahydrofolate cyclo-ligase